MTRPVENIVIQKALSQSDAKAIVALLDAIDQDHLRDFIDSVCAARESIPAGAESAIRNAAADLYNAQVQPERSDRLQPLVGLDGGDDANTA